MHIRSALIVGHRLAMEDRGFLAISTGFWFCLLLWDCRLRLLFLLWLITSILDTIQEPNLLLSVPCTPRTNVRTLTIDNLAISRVLSLSFQLFFLAVGGSL